MWILPSYEAPYVIYTTKTNVDPKLWGVYEEDVVELTGVGMSYMRLLCPISLLAVLIFFELCTYRVLFVP